MRNDDAIAYRELARLSQDCVEHRQTAAYTEHNAQIYVCSVNQQVKHALQRQLFAWLCRQSRFVLSLVAVVIKAAMRQKKAHHDCFTMQNWQAA